MHAAPDDSFLLVADVFGTVRCLETDSGEVRWERVFGMNNVHSVRASLDGTGTVLLEEGRLIRLDKSGEDVWETSVGALRSAFDVSADGGLVALSAAVHEITDGNIKIGSKVTLYGDQGKWLADITLDHAVTRLRFTSERGDLVCASPEGFISFLKDRTLAKQTNLGSAVDGLVSCLDGSLILMPAGGDGIHVLSAAMQSLGVLEVSGTVEDIDVSEDGSTILVKERDGLIYLLDGHFQLRWRGRVRRPVLRVDLASDGSHAFIAESTGQVVRMEFKPGHGARADAPADTAGARNLEPVKVVELGGAPLRAGLGRTTCAGDTVAVLPRPTQLLIVGAGATELMKIELDFHAAHATSDATSPQLALWSNRRLSLVDGKDQRAVSELSVAAVTFCDNGDLVVGTASGEVHRYATPGEQRWSVRVGAGVIGVAQAPDGGPLVALCADGCVSVVDADGVIQATRELSAPAIAHPDVVADPTEDDTVIGEQNFWSHYGRAYQLVMSSLGPVLYHGGGRVLLLDLRANVVKEVHLGAELKSVYPMGNRLLVVEPTGQAVVLAADLTVEARFALSSNEALAARLDGESVVLDHSDESVLLRDLAGHVVAHHAVYPPPRALAVSANGSRAAVVLDTKLLVFDLSQ